jgi:hypothetical protein
LHVLLPAISVSVSEFCAQVEVFNSNTILAWFSLFPP